MARARGRPQKPYRTTWGEIVPGLYRAKDGRWRIVAAGMRFTEADERRAVLRFRQWQAEHEDTTVPVFSSNRSLPPLAPAYQWPDGKVTYSQLGKFLASEDVDGFQRGYRVPADLLWPWLREQLITRPDHVAKMTGIPELARLRELPLPRPPIKLTDMIDAYLEHAPAKDKSKRETVSTVGRLQRVTGAKTLADLTTEALLAFRADVEGDGNLKSAGTRAAYFARVKSTIAFGLKVGMDSGQIRAALDRAKVLWTNGRPPAVNPQPISPADFRALLKAGGGRWRPWLLCGLNLCMHLGEVCQLRWEEFDLGAKTYAAIRGKTAAARIPRAAVLWPETAKALKALPRKGPYVFTSSHGTRFNRNGRGNDFAELRAKARVPDSVKFDSIRDGAYTAACHGTSDERHARVLAGHKAHGLQDNYVLRNPEITRAACAAVRKAYTPF